MSATMARQGGRVQLEQSDMRLALNTAKMAKEGFLRAAIEETKYLIKKSRAEVREEKKRGVEFPGHKKVKAAIQRHPAMLRHNQTSGCLPCQNVTAKNSADTLVTQRNRCTPPPPRPTQSADSRADSTSARQATRPNRYHLQSSTDWNRQFAGRIYLFIYSSSLVEFSEDDEDTEHDTDFDPDMLTDDG